MKKLLKNLSDKLIKIDIIGGHMTYSQRVDLSTILSDPKLTNRERYCRVISCLHPEWVEEQSSDTIAYYDEIREGIEWWIDKENINLSHTPSADELSAGSAELSKLLGPMQTIKALATQYSQDPDNIWGWKYNKVFTLLFTDLEQFKYTEKVREIQEKRMNSKKR